MKDSHHLQRFIDAQNQVIDQVRVELKAGRKQSHWMWFIFPQLAGLGQSEMARRYSIASIEEAKAYLGHPLLSERLRACTALVNAVEDRSIEQIFDYPDDMKFRSSMTLFAQATSNNAIYLEALQKYFDGEADSLTLNFL
jgi:uncharacterized protein (DUF1810 family)